MSEEMRIHFIFDPKKNPDAPFANIVIGELDQANFEDATHFVTIGGDGTLMKIMRRTHGGKVADPVLRTIPRL